MYAHHIVLQRQEQIIDFWGVSLKFWEIVYFESLKMKTAELIKGLTANDKEHIVLSNGKYVQQA